MKYYTKPPKRKYEWHFCTKCGEWRYCTWHHVKRKRYGNEWVWLCITCHKWVHNNPNKAEKLGLYIRLDSKMNMKKKKRKCKTHVYLAGKCQFCGKPMDSFSSKKKLKKLEGMKPVSKKKPKRKDKKPF